MTRHYWLQNTTLRRPVLASAVERGLPLAWARGCADAGACSNGQDMALPLLQV